MSIDAMLEETGTVKLVTLQGVDGTDNGLRGSNRVGAFTHEAELDGAERGSGINEETPIPAGKLMGGRRREQEA